MRKHRTGQIRQLPRGGDTPQGCHLGECGPTVHFHPNPGHFLDFMIGPALGSLGPLDEGQVAVTGTAENPKGLVKGIQDLCYLKTAFPLALGSGSSSSVDQC